MSIKNRSTYLADWPAISARIRFERAGGQCECCGACGLDHGGRCDEHHARDAVTFAGRVILTVAHLDHNPAHNDDANLAAMCQACHLRYDRSLHASHARQTRERKSGQGVLQFGRLP